LTNVSSAKGAATLTSFAYTLGAAGNRTSVAEQGGRKVDYTYDALYRLTSETITNAPVSGSVGYTYDAVGNRLSRTSTVTGVPSTSNTTFDQNDRLSSDGYDSNGNTVVSGSNGYVYDFENRLVKVNAGTPNEISITYDGDGNRVAKTVGGVTTRYLVDTSNLTDYAQVVEELVNGSVTRQYTYGNNLINQRQVISGNWQTSFFQYDGHGSTRALTDMNGAVTDTFTYDAFGILVARSGGTPNARLYTGEEYDADTGMYNLRARWMNPATGRFWSQDSYEGDGYDPITLHKYLYANVDPVNGIDPSGHVTVMEALNTTFAIATLASISAYTVAAGLRYYGETHLAEQVEGFGRIANGIAFMASPPRFGPYGAAAFVAGIDEVVVGADQMVNGGRPPSPLEQFLVKIGLSKNAATNTVGISKLLLTDYLKTESDNKML